MAILKRYNYEQNNSENKDLKITILIIDKLGKDKFEKKTMKKDNSEKEKLWKGDKSEK